MNFTFADM